LELEPDRLRVTEAERGEVCEGFIDTATSAAGDNCLPAHLVGHRSPRRVLEWRENLVRPAVGHGLRRAPIL